MKPTTKTSIIAPVLELSKVKITFAVSITTITGYVLAKGEIDSGFLVATFGIFLLACGASVLNHIQERKWDKNMPRTQSRPLVKGLVSLRFAWILALAQVALGTYLLHLGSNLSGIILGLLALVWYNLIYTPLKRVTPNAVIPGSLIGSFPPLVGWVTGGADLWSHKAFAIALFFFIWQVPHFYLLQLKYGPEYEKAGFPSIASRYTKMRFRMIVFYWIILTAVSALLVFWAQVVQSWISLIGVSFGSIWLIYIFIKPVFDANESFTTGKYFMRINYYILWVVLLLNLDPLLFASIW